MTMLLEAPVRLTPVLDASLLPETIDFEVTADDIALGCRGDAHNCPITRAIVRAFALRGMSVAANTSYECTLVYGWDNDELGGSMTSDCAVYDHGHAAFVVRFDEKMAVQPFSGSLRRQYDEYE